MLMNGCWRMNDQTIFAMYAISIVALLQLVAWYLSFNGQVFAFTSLIIGAVVGSVLGFSLNKREVK